MVLFTNALNIKMQSNIKPKKPVNIKLPLHSSIIQPDDLLIISSDKDIPETEDDWEICSTNVNIQGNTVTFDAEHFTRYMCFIVGEVDIQYINLRNTTYKHLIIGTMKACILSKCIHR